MGIVICKIPKAGLGNQLFPLMKASVFASINELPLVILGYNQFKIGPYLRGDKSKRKYTGYFSFQKSILGEQVDRLKLLQYATYKKEEDPRIQRLPESRKQKTIFSFSTLPHWSDYFEDLKQHRELVMQLFRDWINPAILDELDHADSPVIGVHIRMGDFRKLNSGEDFSKTGAVRTPEEYFVKTIQLLRKIAGKELAVSLFTDGYRHELGRVMGLRNIELVEGNPDILDMLQLSRSQVIVSSAGSTFSYWAGFLSQASLIMHPDHIHEPIRPDELNAKYYEGALSEDSVSPLLEMNLKQIAGRG
jgi:hypothetical protein